MQGLQRAFHLAGCPNVVASLWKVNDAATAALMNKFYHELWVNKRPSAEALREAQLTIYRHPELIRALAGERGRRELEKAVRAQETRPTANGARADTKLWAAIVLSGLGKVKPWKISARKVGAGSSSPAAWSSRVAAESRTVN